MPLPPPPSSPPLASAAPLRRRSVDPRAVAPVTPIRPARKTLRRMERSPPSWSRSPPCPAGVSVRGAPGSRDESGMRKLSWAEVDGDALDLGEALQHPLERELASDAALLEAAVGLAGQLARALVDL